MACISREVQRSALTDGKGRPLTWVNSVVLILNDHLYAIEKKPEEFVQEMAYAINDVGCSGKQQRTFYPGQSMLVTCNHADTVAVIAVGGNHATVLGLVHNGGKHYTKDDQESVLRALADQHGFRLVRKPKRKSTT